MIWTSYFARKKQFLNQTVAITAEKPHFFDGPWYSHLGPPKQLVKLYKNNEITQNEFVYVYYDIVLNNLEPQKIYNDIIKNYDEECILMCFEGASKFCHRHIVKNWFNNNFLKCEEAP